VIQYAKKLQIICYLLNHVYHQTFKQILIYPIEFFLQIYYYTQNIDIAFFEDPILIEFFKYLNKYFIIPLFIFESIILEIHSQFLYTTLFNNTRSIIKISHNDLLSFISLQIANQTLRIS